MHRGGHIHVVSQRYLTFARGLGEIGRSGVCRLSELRRITQGTRGEAGQRYHERIWSAIATGKKQDRSFFDFLLHSITAYLNSTPAPSLLHYFTTSLLRV